MSWYVMLLKFETYVPCFHLDPSPWLLVSDELKEKNKAKPYDPKKSVWVNNKVGINLQNPCSSV